MKLRDYLEQHELTEAEFGARIGRTREAVRRYCNGERIPDRETMPLIVAETSGEVTANDFYDVELLQPGDRDHLSPATDIATDPEVAS